MHRTSMRGVRGLSLVLGLLFAWILCRGCYVSVKRGAPMGNAEFKTPKSVPDDREDAAMPYHPGEEFSRADTAKQKREASLMAIEGVEGVGTSQDAIGNKGIVFYFRDPDPPN